MSQSEQLAERGMRSVGMTAERALDERAARSSLRSQVARLERELSEIHAGAFPHIPVGADRVRAGGGPRLLDLASLERLRDELAVRVGEAQLQLTERRQFELESWRLLREMQRNPARYKFVRLPVRDLGQSGCGAWQVRPRLGLIGMLAGWWQLKLSSGCPLARGCARRRSPPSSRRGIRQVRPSAVHGRRRRRR